LLHPDSRASFGAMIDDPRRKEYVVIYLDALAAKLGATDAKP